MSGTPKADAPATERTRVAGRELDAEVAEKVMGCHLGWGPRGQASTQPYRDPACRCGNGEHAVQRESDYYTPTELLHYSTDIAAAWLVLGEVRDHGWLVSLRDISSENESWWECDFRFHDSDAEVTALADMAPLAICLAALAALAPSVPERVVAPSRKDQGAQA